MIQKYFNKKELIAIRNACTEAEKTTSGELRVSILKKGTKSK